MSEKKKKPMTLKGVLALVGAGLVYLVSQLLGIDLSALTGGKAGKDGNPPATAPAEPGAAKEQPKKEVPAQKQRDDTALIRQFYQEKRSDDQVEAEGEIVHILPDDTDEKPHQLFLVELSNGITIKISHNTAVAPYVPIKKGDTIRFFGEYEYNDKGGVVHWTHRTQGTRNKHPHGWLLHKGKKYD